MHESEQAPQEEDGYESAYEEEDVSMCSHDASRPEGTRNESEKDGAANALYVSLADRLPADVRSCEQKMSCRDQKVAETEKLDASKGTSKVSVEDDPDETGKLQ